MNIAETLSARPIASSNYVAKWGEWEALRELVCNAIDADPDRYILDYRGTDTVSIYTTTTPSYHECCVVGEGSKDSHSGTIGQFGEGLKLAALTAIRMKGSLSIRTPLFTATYELREEPGARHPILWIKPRRVPESQSKPGCLITLTIPGADFPSFRSHFLARDAGARITPPALEPDSPPVLRVYNKGILISKFTGLPSLCDYNFRDLQINRDRSIVANSSLYLAYLNILVADPNPDVCTALVNDVTSAHFESNALAYLNYTASSYARLVHGLAAAVKARYGDKVCLPLSISNSRKDEYARSLGYTIASDLNIGVLSVLRDVGAIPDVDDVTTAPDFVPTPCSITPAQRTGLNRILSAVTAVLALDPSTIELIQLLTIDAFDPAKAPPDTANLQCCGTPDNKIAIFLSLSLINDTDATPASVAGSVILGLASSRHLAERFSHKSESIAAHFLGLAAISLLPA